MEKDHRNNKRPRFLRGGQRKTNQSANASTDGGTAQNEQVGPKKVKRDWDTLQVKGNGFSRRSSAKDDGPAKPIQNQVVPLPTKDDFLFLPLGGSGEIGMNVNLYGTNKQWIMVDLGISFGDDGNGIDFVTANLNFLKTSGVAQNLKGVVITHAHEDHIGGVHEIWPHFKFHVYVTKFSKEVLLNKLEGKTYKGELVQYYLHEIPLNGRFSIGDFALEFLDITHSIPESNALLIKTPIGSVFHTGDWKLDPGPVLGIPIAEGNFRRLANENILAMVCDSTNALVPGRCGSEKTVYDALHTLIGGIKKGRIIASCFASNLARIKGLADAAFANGREVCLLGRSIDRMTEAAEKCRYPIYLDKFITADIARRLPREKVMYIATGTQGDEKAALARIARGVHRSVHLSDGDTVIMSSKIIPGNERNVSIMFNNLARLGVNIITEKQELVHVSGHPYQGDLKEMYDWVKPKYVMPVHGEILHLTEHAKFANKCGFKTFVPENGMLVSLTRMAALRSYDIGRWGFDGNRFINMASQIINQRKLMGTNGSIFATLMMDKQTNRFMPEQSVISVSGLMEDAGEELIAQIKTGLVRLLNKPKEEEVQAEEKLTSEAMRTPKVRERINTVIRSSINKAPLVTIHWTYR